MKNRSGEIVPVSQTRSDAPTATTATDSSRAHIWWVAGWIPSERAATPSSRTALASRAERDRR